MRLDPDEQNRCENQQRNLSRDRPSNRPLRLDREVKMNPHSNWAGLVLQNGAMWLDTRVLEQVADLLHDTAFFIKDREGRYRVVNQSLVERHGLNSKSQMINKRPCDVCPGEFGSIPTEQDQQVLKTGRPILERLEMFWRRPHLPVWGLTSKYPIRDAGGGIQGLIGISKDLTSLAHQEEVHEAVARVLRQAELSIDQPMSPSSLARQADMSPVRFARMVKRVHGISPMQWITKTRITLASAQLRDTDLSVAEIALQCGFSDHSAFTRAFRTTTGLPPIQYRKLNRRVGQ